MPRPSSSSPPQGKRTGRTSRFRERIPMRSPLSCLVTLLLAAAAAAAPVPAGNSAGDPAARKQLHAEALTYAQQLLNVSSQVSFAYVKPVSRTDLLHAALLGLFETARQP